MGKALADLVAGDDVAYLPGAFGPREAYISRARVSRTGGQGARAWLEVGGKKYRAIDGRPRGGTRSARPAYIEPMTPQNTARIEGKESRDRLARVLETASVSELTPTARHELADLILDKLAAEATAQVGAYLDGLRRGGG